MWNRPKLLTHTGIMAAAALLLSVTFASSAPPASAQTKVVLSQSTQAGAYPADGGLDGGEPAGSTMGVNQQGQVIFGNTYGNTIYELNPATGVVTTLGSLGNVGAVAVDAQNNYYFTNLYGPAIVKIPYVNGAYATFNASPTVNCTGSDTAACNVPGLANGANGYYFGVLALTFDASGDLFFSLTNGNTAPNAIFECNAACTTGNGTAVKLFQEPTAAGDQLVLGGLATDATGDVFFTDSAQNSVGSTSSNVNELVYTTGTGYAAAPLVLYTYTPATVTSSDDQIDAVNVDAGGTVYFATTYDGIFAFPATAGVVNTGALYAVSTQGAKVMATDGKGNFFVDTNISSGDVIDQVSVGSLVVPTATVGSSSSASNVTTILNGTLCTTSPTVTFAATENGTATTDFSATTSGSCADTAVAAASYFPTTVTFSPSVTGAANATLTATDSGGNTGTASITGIGSAQPSAASPTFSTPAGTYTAVTSVALADSTSGAQIYYTIDGSTPTTSSTLYSGPITVSASETIKAIAAVSSYLNSAVASAAYIINLPAAATPTFSPTAGIYTSIQTVTLADTTSGAAVYYTTDGSAPTASSTLYNGAITVSASETVNAIAVASGFSNSAVGSAAYTINLPAAAAPTFSPGTGTYTSSQTVAIGDATSGATIYYTTDGTMPTTSSMVYSGSLTVGSTETLQAIAVATGYSTSTPASATFTIQLPAATPAFSTAAGTYNGPQAVTITDATAGTTIYYTTDGSRPTTSSAVYSGAIAVTSTATLQAIASGNGYSASPIASASFTIVQDAATPLFSVAAGTYTSVQSVMITTGTPGATLYYTLDGSTPTTNSLVYSGPLQVGVNETVEAIAIAPGYNPSAVTMAAYIINLPPQAFALSLTPAMLSITAGTSGSVTLSVTPQNGFSSAVSFSCSGLPADTGCTFSPATVTPTGGASASTTLTVSSTTPFASLRGTAPWIPGASLAAVFCLLGFKKRRRFQMLAMLVLGVTGLSLISGCGTSKPAIAPPSTSTSTVTVTGTAGSVQSSTTFTLTLQ